jgi:competence protein ComEA
MTNTADRLATDLAQVLEDGAEIVVPTKGSFTNTSTLQSSSIAIGSTSRKHKLVLGESININQATASQLEELPGIGAKRAQAILLFKKQHGAFLSLSSLQGIKGIGEKELQKLLPFCRIG